ncbi:MAG: FAD-dependent oxidoreductase [Hyphomicrobiaceae bacterium]
MTDTMSAVVIGAGHAASEAVTALRKEGFKGTITVIGEEPYYPYHRPPLSKTYLAEQQPPESLYIRNPEIYEREGAAMLIGRRAVAIDRGAHEIMLADGDIVSYDRLVIATGGRPRRLNLQGADLPGIFYVRTIADIEAIRPRVRPGARAVVIGGGYIGLEAAAMLRKLGVGATVLEAAPRVLQRVTAPELSAFYERVHREEGVSVETDVRIAAVEGDQQVRAVRLLDGRVLDADFVVVGVGIDPAVEIARDAGLTLENGIAVDDQCRTSDPDIFSAGDCASFVSRHYGYRVRLESVQNAYEQARVAAAVIAGRAVVHDVIPWFWSDQFDLKLQITGLSQGYDEVVLRGDPRAGAVSRPST